MSKAFWGAFAVLNAFTYMTAMESGRHVLAAFGELACAASVYWFIRAEK